MRSGAPFWPKPEHAHKLPALTADLTVDVAVVGGGITGLTCALILAEAGKRVALLEARQVGAGVSGATTAHATEVIDTRYYELESKFGREQAALVRASSRDAIELIAAFCSAAPLDCGFRRLSGYLLAETGSQAEKLAAELTAAERAGLAVERAEAPVSWRTAAALRFANQAQFQPAAYLVALTDRARKAGVLIFENTPVLDVDRKQSSLLTESGKSVRAEALVLATHAPFVKTGLELKLAQYRSYLVAGPCPNAPDALLWDMHEPYHYVRRVTVDGHHYLLAGGSDHRTGEVPAGGAEAPFRALDEYAARFGARVEHRWSAQVVEPADGLPFIGRPDAEQGIYIATGFSGNGTTFGTLSAMVIADQVLGRHNRYAELYRADRSKPLASLVPVVTENAETAVHATVGHLRGVSDEPIASLPQGGGGIFDRDGNKLAVHRDDDGKLHVLSATCTHKGCQVAWNAVERSWDCPCHGSRFDIHGRVLDAPATKPLERREL